MNTSNHFPSEDWVDFERNTAPVERQDAMRRHLDEGCRNCTEQHNAWSQVVRLARAEARYQPPAHALHLAKALYQAPKTEGALARTMEAVRMLFDSRLAPVPVGVRSGSAMPRKLLFAHDSFLIDLQVERAAVGSGKTVLIGQITTSLDRSRSIDGVQVLVLNKTRAIAKTTTSRLGEFHVEFEPVSERVSLVLGFESQETVIHLEV